MGNFDPQTIDTPMSSSNPATIEGEQVAAIFEPTLIAGTSWHIVSHKWWQSWCDYTGFSPDFGRVMKPSNGQRPGTIDNTILLDPEYADEGILRKDIMEGVDYALIDGRTGELLHGIYGGGPVIARSVITYGARKKTRIDLYPIYLTLIDCKPEDGKPDATKRVVQSFTAKTTFSDIQELRHNEAIEASKKSQSRPGPGSMMPSSSPMSTTDEQIEEARTNEADGQAERSDRVSLQTHTRKRIYASSLDRKFLEAGLH